MVLVLVLVMVLVVVPPPLPVPVPVPVLMSVLLPGDGESSRSRRSFRPSAAAVQWYPVPMKLGASTLRVPATGTQHSRRSRQRSGMGQCQQLWPAVLCPMYEELLLLLPLPLLLLLLLLLLPSSLPPLEPPPLRTYVRQGWA